MSKDPKGDLDFSDEELSALEQSLENRSRIDAAPGRPRKRTHKRGLRVPADIVPRRRARGSESLDDLPGRPPSSKTLPLTPLPEPPSPEQPMAPPAEDSTPTLPMTASAAQPPAEERTPPPLPPSLPPPLLAPFADDVTPPPLPPDLSDDPREARGDVDPEDAPTIPAMTAVAVEAVGRPSPPAPSPRPALAPTARRPSDMDTEEIPDEVWQRAIAEPPEDLGAGPPPPEAIPELDDSVEVEAVATEEPAAPEEEPEEGDTVKLPAGIVQQAVRVALELATDAATAKAPVPAAARDFDLDGPTGPGASEALEELSDRQRAVGIGRIVAVDGEETEDQERANRVAILLSALKGPQPAKPAAHPDDAAPEITHLEETAPILDAATAPTLEPEPASPPPLPPAPFPLASDLREGRPEPEELSTEELVEVPVEEGPVEARATEAPPPIPDTPPSPFFESEKEPAPVVVVRVPVAEPDDDVMTSAPPEPHEAPPTAARRTATSTGPVAPISVVVQSQTASLGATGPLPTAAPSAPTAAPPARPPTPASTSTAAPPAAPVVTAPHPAPTITATVPVTASAATAHPTAPAAAVTASAATAHPPAPSATAPAAPAPAVTIPPPAPIPATPAAPPLPPSAAAALTGVVPPGPPSGPAVTGPLPPPPPPAAAQKPEREPEPRQPRPDAFAPEPTPQVRGRKRKKSWFEEIFDEDWLRTLQRISADQIRKQVDFLEESLQPATESQILDLGCGEGRTTIELAARGYHVTGYDLSLPLLIRAADEAQRRSLQVNFIHGDFRELAFEEQFDAIYCLFTSFGYFDDDSNRKMIQAVASALRAGGRFLLDVVNRDYAIRDLPARIWWEGQGCVVLEEVDFNYFTSRIISKRSVVFEDGRHLEQEISARAYSLHELGKILHHAGFRVLEVTGHLAHRTRFFGNCSRSLVLLAEKRAP
jgi:SAM-dependent methyltransferase